MDTSNVFPRVRTILADVLAIDESEIRPDASVIRDLGAESIDLADLVFQLEQEFGVKIPRGQIERDARGELAPEDFSHQGRVTEQGLQRLREFLVEVPEDRFKPDLRVAEIPLLFTVETFCRVVLRS